VIDTDPTVFGRQAPARRGLPALGSAARLGMPLFWLLLAAFILAPCACFLLLAVSPRLFSQGNQWFTLTYLHQALTGATAVAIVNSLWVSCAAAALGIAIGFPIAWLVSRTTLPGSSSRTA
jgi:iron(III) transport system permease protein